MAVVLIARSPGPAPAWLEVRSGSDPTGIRGGVCRWPFRASIWASTSSAGTTPRAMPSPQEGAERAGRPRHLVPQVRARVDDEVPPQLVEALRAQADARVVLEEHADHRLRRDLLLLEAQAGRRRLRLGHAPRGDEGDVREARHPRSRAQVPRRGHEPVRLRGRVPQEPRRPGAQGHPLHEHGPGAHRLPGDRAEVLRHGDPARRQQVRRAQLRGVVGGLVHLRAAGRARRHAAAGVLPHQRGERRSVRAHVDHRRRRRVGALRRGLLGAGVHERLAALGRGGAHRQARARGFVTRPSRTGRRTSTTSSPSGRGPRPKRPSSGSTATSVRSSR